MKHFNYIGKATLVILLTSATAQAGGKLTWFGETTFTGAYPTSSSSLSRAPSTVGSGLIGYRPGWPLQSGQKLLEQQLDLDRVFNSAQTENKNSHSIRSELGVSLGEEAISLPLSYRRAEFANGDSQQLDSVGLKWRHSFEGAGDLTLAARYGKGAYQFSDYPAQDTANTLASVSWTSGFIQSGVTGSLYIGDERLNEAEVSEAARRIYGFAVGGHWKLTGEHTPYLSLRYQTTDQLPVTGLTDLDRYTRISAGWNWQVRSNWQVRAEADFTYEQPRLNLLDFDRTRIQFSTRYDIK